MRRTFVFELLIKWRLVGRGQHNEDDGEQQQQMLDDSTSERSEDDRERRIRDGQMRLAKQPFDLEEEENDEEDQVEDLRRLVLLLLLLLFTACLNCRFLFPTSTRSILPFTARLLELLSFLSCG